MMTAVLYFGFQRVRRLAVDTAEAHLQASSHQLVTTFQQAGGRSRREMAQIAAQPAIVRGLSPLASSGDLDSTRRTIAAMARAPQVAAVGLWDREGRLVAAAGDQNLAEASKPRWDGRRGARGGYECFVRPARHTR